MSLEAQLRKRLSGRVVLVGIGNVLRGDDGAGHLLARLTEGRVKGRVIDAEEVPENVLGPIIASEPDTIVLVDAVDLGAEPGAIALLEADQVAGYPPTTHRVPLNLLMDYLHRRTGADVFLVAIQPRDVAMYGLMSPEVIEAVARLSRLIKVLLSAPVAAFQSQDVPEEVG